MENARSICSSSGLQHSDKTVASAQTLRSEYATFKAQIDKTLEALDKVVTSQASDLRPAFDGFSAEVGRLESQAKRVVSRSRDLASRGREYIQSWEKQLADMQNPELRERAEQRRAQASAQLDDTKDELERIRQDYNKFMGDLKEIKTVLENDLNPAGVAAIKDIIEKTKSDAVPVKNDIDTIIAGLDRITAALSGT